MKALLRQPSVRLGLVVAVLLGVVLAWRYSRTSSTGSAPADVLVDIANPSVATPVIFLAAHTYAIFRARSTTSAAMTTKKHKLAPLQTMKVWCTVRPTRSKMTRPMAATATMVIARSGWGRRS